jgi:plastocyanin
VPREVATMSRRIPGLIGLMVSLELLFVATVRLAAAPPVAAGDPCYHSFVMPAHTVDAADQIKVAPCAFGPTVALVPVGATVTFFNGPDFTHLITGANQDWGSRDVELKPGATVSYTFDKPGVYPYACALHRGMSGAIVVGDAKAALASTAVAGAGASSGASAAGGSAATVGPAVSVEPGAAALTTESGASTGGGPIGVAFLIGAVFGAIAAGSLVWLAIRRRSAVRSSAARPAE